MLKKTDIVLKTYEVLTTKAPEDVTMADVITACDCTENDISSFFEDFNDLVLLASVHFLTDYIRETQETLSRIADPLDILLFTWMQFAEHAFKNINVFLYLFWGPYKDRLSDTIFFYYQLFPDENKGKSSLLTSMFFNNDIKERNYIIVRQAANAGYFPRQNARLISDAQCYMMHGVLLDYRNRPQSQNAAEDGPEYFMSLLESLTYSPDGSDGTG